MPWISGTYTAPTCIITSVGLAWIPKRSRKQLFMQFANLCILLNLAQGSRARVYDKLQHTSVHCIPTVTQCSTPYSATCYSSLQHATCAVLASLWSPSVTVWYSSPFFKIIWIPFTSWTAISVSDFFIIAFNASCNLKMAASIASMRSVHSNSFFTRACISFTSPSNFDSGLFVTASE